MKGRALLRALVGPVAVLLALPAYSDAPPPIPLNPLPLAEMGFALRPVGDGALVFHGVNENDASGGQPSSMMYQMPAGAGLAGLFAAIVTHGTINEATRRAQIAKAEKAADVVLVPYRGVLGELRLDDLLRQALEQVSTPGEKRLLAASDTSASGWQIDSGAMFSMTQDQRALILDNVITIRDATATDPVYRTVVRVVSDARSEDDPRQAWLATDGRILRDASVGLYAQSLDLLLKMLSAPPKSLDSAAFRTFRYVEGGRRKFERAQLLQLDCARVLVRTLRGTLMSIPQSHEEVEAIVEDGLVVSPPGCVTATSEPH